jgi:Uma2 family endonuclease
MSWQDQSMRDAEPAQAAVPPSRRMTEEEFLAWCDEDTRAEWVEGEVVMMSPASTEHTRLVSFLSSVLEAFAERHELGEVLGPESQIRLPEPPSRRVPDLYFISKARLGLVQKNHFEGPPDLCIEIVSPDSEARDWREKYLEYEAAGVKEYWVIDPASEHVEVYTLAEQEDGPPKYERVPEQQGAIVSTVLSGLRLPTEWLWTETRPKMLEAIEKLGLVG